MTAMTYALTGTPNEHVQAASVQLQADEMLAELLACVEAFGSASLIEGKHGLLAVPYFGRSTERGLTDRDWIEAEPCDDGYLLRLCKASYLGTRGLTIIINHDQAAKIC